MISDSKFQMNQQACKRRHEATTANQMTQSMQQQQPKPPSQPSQDHPLLGPDYIDTFNIRDELNAAPRPRPQAGSAGSQIADFYRNRSVLITGASGFIGKVLIEKLLRTCPTIRRIFVLIRPKWNKQPQERLRELLEAPLFDGVRRCAASGRPLEARVQLVEGDVTQRQLGLSQRDLLQVLQEVSVIFHSAATVKFDEPLKQSVAINIAGTRNMLELCRRMPKLAALVHVSTAYANCQRHEVDEHVYLDEQLLDPEQLIQMAEWLDQDTLQELKRRLLGARPNTYTYTKALAEWLLVKSGRDLPVVVCRPSIVAASWREPFSGWIDNVNGPTGIILGAGKGLIRSMFAEQTYVADLVPVDTTISTIVALGWFAHHYKAHKQQLAIVTDVDCGVLAEASAADSLIDTLSPSSSASFASSASHSVAHSDGESCDEANMAPPSPPQTPTQATEVALADLSIDVAAAAGELHQQQPDGDSNNNQDFQRDQYEPESENKAKQHQIVYSVQRQHLDDGYGSSRSSSGYAHSSSASSRSSSSSSASSTSSSSSSSSSSRKHKRLAAMKQQQHNSIITSDRCNNSLSSTNLNINHNQTSSSESQLDAKFRQFRQKLRQKLQHKDLPEELADVPVFHCTSGGENPITWGRIQILVISILTMFPTIQAYRYPRGSFTNKSLIDKFYRITLHYIPGYLVDSIIRLQGGKPILVKLFRKFDQAADVLQTFTSKQWKFAYDNRLALMNDLMNDEDRRLFNCDIKQLDWQQFLTGYTIGVRKFMLKEPMSNLEQARKNLSFLYYRNLSIQVLVAAIGAYLVVPSSWLMAPLAAIWS